MAQSSASFNDLLQVFITKFLSNKKQPMMNSTLMVVKQKADESMRSYAKRFNNIYSQVYEPTEKMVS